MYLGEKGPHHDFSYCSSLRAGAYLEENMNKIITLLIDALKALPGLVLVGAGGLMVLYLLLSAGARITN